ncbi:HNH endonuclease signature motif containing protein [Pseudomonas sp. NKUCC02_KPG]|uniref:HNH endonuclease signature motif containing protein n=1 Tax=Pseudomonas sp. NKUCC02_KPG TaxID=2842124 RepID=UPI001C5AA640|nr:HNH endonuclease signature motif containing protein [Pseudomonas sp. NKUCC02_KPG]MBW3504676.1 HNH endonuclease [Pseudomonas sp. NKUCC02_KPG]
MWNLKRPSLTSIRSDLDALFPEGTGAGISDDDKLKVLELYDEYKEAMGEPNPVWKTKLLSNESRDLLLTAYGEVSDKGELSLLRAALKKGAKKCPYCGFGEIRDLDHHLPKKHYKCFSVFALNLVPSCSKCNGHKPRTPPSAREKYHIHAYLDDVSDFNFLVADIEISDGALSVIFSIEKRKGMSNELTNRLRQHLTDFKLNERYIAQITNYLESQETGLDDNFRLGGASEVRAYLLRTADSIARTNGANDWRGALVVALAESDEFCDGGFYEVLGFT